LLILVVSCRLYAEFGGHFGRLDSGRFPRPLRAEFEFSGIFFIFPHKDLMSCDAPRVMTGCPCCLRPADQLSLLFKTDCLKSGFMLASFRDVVALWPSPDALAAEIGAGMAAARKWPQRDNIPAEWWIAILRTETAKSAGVTAELLAELAARMSASARA
jgi:hypothetical protein